MRLGLSAAEGLLVVLAGHEVDDLLVDVDAAFGDEQADRAAGHRDGVHIELHRGLLCILAATL
jgi:hypothetical protein